MRMSSVKLNPDTENMEKRRTDTEYLNRGSGSAFQFSRGT